MLPAHDSAAVCAAADWPAAAVLATQTLQKPDFIASHATGQRRTEGVGRARPEEDGPFSG
jgi:hypothetical protein